MQTMPIASFMDYLVAQEAAHRDQALTLTTECRGDEADFEKIRANVYGIFKAILETAVKLHGESDKAVEFFSLKLRELSTQWRAALSQAREKGDSSSAMVKKLMLEAAGDIEKEFAERRASAK